MPEYRFDQGGQRLLKEERIAPARFQKARTQHRRNLRAGNESLDQPLGFRRAQGLEQEGDRVHLPTTPPRSKLQELGAGHTHEHDGSVPRPVRDVFDQVQKSRLGPLEIVERDYEWAPPPKSLEKLPHRPESLLEGTAGSGQPDELAHSARDGRSILFVANQSVDL